MQSVIGEVCQSLYSPMQKILTIGDGDLSFSLCLCNLFNSGSNLTVTTYDSLQVLKVKYDPFILKNIKDLHKLKATLINEIDARKLDSYGFPTFDRIVWNFPHSGFPDKPNGPGFEHEALWLQSHQEIVRMFFRTGQKLLEPNGQMHITNKTVVPFGQWGIQQIAEEEGLRLLEIRQFNFKHFPGYENRRGNGKNPARRFPAEDAVTFIFDKP